MRPPTASEISVIRWFAERTDESQRQSLLSDLEKATVEEIRDEQLALRFEIDGYSPPSEQNANISLAVTSHPTLYSNRNALFDNRKT